MVKIRASVARRRGGRDGWGARPKARAPSPPPKPKTHSWREPGRVLFGESSLLDSPNRKWEMGKSILEYMNHYHLIYTPKGLLDLSELALPYDRYVACGEMGKGGFHYHVYIETTYGIDKIRDTLKEVQKYLPAKRVKSPSTILSGLWMNTLRTIRLKIYASLL